MQTPAEFIQEWLKRASSSDAEAIVSLYKEDAILLGTLDAKVRKGRNEIREYFEYFLTFHPCGKITSLIDEEVGNKTMAVANGTYVFEINEGVKTTTLPARFTFVLEKAGKNWEILSHHSSKQP